VEQLQEAEPASEMELAEPTEEEIQSAIREMAQKARQRLVFDGCGGLPGPKILRNTFARKILNRLVAKHRT